MTRSAAREIAVLILFAQSFSGYSPEELLKEWLDPAFYETLADDDPLFKRPPDSDSAVYIRRLVSGALERLPELDAHIEKHSVGWGLGRMPRTAISILRAAIFELLYMPDVPRAAAINAHLDIAKRYDTLEVVAFINGILGSFFRTTLKNSEPPGEQS